MRNLRLALLALCAIAPLFVAPVHAEGVHHDLEVTLDPAARRLEVVDRLRLQAGEHTLRLAPALTVGEASAGGKPLAVDRKGAALRLTVPDGAGEVVLRYAGTLAPLSQDARGDGPMAGEEGAFLPGGSGWFPSTGDEPPTWRLSVRVPAPFVAVATGRLVEEARGGSGFHAVFAEDRKVEEPSLFAGPWQVKERRYGDLRLRTYFHPEQAGLADDYLDLTARTIDEQSRRIGAYPFTGFSIVSAPLPVGLGFPGLTYIGRQVLPLPFIRAQSLPHEILHNWWGNGVRVGEGGNWCEGLTTFMADYAAAESRGPDAARAMRLDWLRDYAALPADRDSALTSFRVKVHDASQIVGYGKAAMLFHMLRAEIGESAFMGGIRRFWQDHKFKDAGWADLRRSFEASSGRDLGPFFEQWLDRVGAPTLRLADAKADGNAVTVTLQQGSPTYALTVPVAVETEQGTRWSTVRLDGREATATIPAPISVGAPPKAVTVDPAFDLFRRLAPGEAPPILRDVTLDHAANTVIAADGDAADAARALAGKLADGKPRIVAPDRTDPVAPLALIGTTEGVDRLLAFYRLPPVPASLAKRGTARVWAFRTPQGRAVLAVAADDASALQALLRPLPHYGRQSWLVFDGSRAEDRGVWPAGASPLRVSLE